MHGDDLDAFVAKFAGMFETGSGFVTEQRYVRRDGSPIWVNNSVGPVLDLSGNVRQASLVTVDITERKRAEEVERRLAAIIESSYDAILSTDLGMRITSWNEGAERLYGYTAVEAIGTSVTMLVPGDRPEEETRIIERIRRGERIEPHETKRRHKDGRLIEVSLTVSPVCDEHGHIVGASKIARDITLRKEAERLQTVLMVEMKHRVKNVLATVQAVARQTFGSDPMLGPASELFESRLLSLAGAHDLISRERWDGADLSAVVERVLAPYRREKFQIGGPQLWLAPKVVLAMALALHELTTNAAKYGALAHPKGQVLVTWEIREDVPDAPRFVLRWEERDGPTVHLPRHKGFGSRLIEGILASELNGRVDLAYRPSGLVCTVEAPLNGGVYLGSPGET
jgi:PAS domain S-box-containing protein